MPPLPVTSPGMVSPVAVSSTVSSPVPEPADTVLTQTMPLPAVPCTAVVGMTSTFSARPAAMVISAARPENTVTSPGTAQLTVVPLVPVPVAAPPVSLLEAPASGVMIVRPVQVKGAGPPSMATEPSVGRDSSRYCCSGLNEPLTEKLGGATWPVASPIATLWPWITLRALSVPAAGASTFTKVTTILGCVTVTRPSASIFSTGSGTVSTRIS